MINGKIAGLGFVEWVIKIKENWFVVSANFIQPTGYTFHKTLYLYNDKKKEQLNRCHSYYLDNEDITKGGGSFGDYSVDEIIATLINHGEEFNEENCAGCRGELPQQTHLIQLLQLFKPGELL